MIRWFIVALGLTLKDPRETDKRGSVPKPHAWYLVAAAVVSAGSEAHIGEHSGQAVGHILSQDHLARASARGFHPTEEETEARGGFISRLSQAFPDHV